MGRLSKLTPESQQKIITALEAGATIKAACDWVPISTVTYFNWINRGIKEQERRENNGIKEGTKQWEIEQPFLDFFNASTRAQTAGLVNAAVQFRAGMNPSKSVTNTTVTTTETRLRTIKHDDGRVEQIPYDHVKSEQRQSITDTPGDWRAAMEYLARRDPESWARQKIDLAHSGKIDTGIEALLKAIQDAKQDDEPAN